MSRNKKILILITTLAAALLLMAGTFAWQQMVNKVNEFIGKKTGVTLHDDFDPKTGQKDVYVENPSETKMFVRIKLNELMSLTTNKPGEITDAWKAHIYGDNAEDCGHANGAGDLFHDYFKWVTGGQKWYMPSNGEQLAQDTGIYGPGDAVNGAKQTPSAEVITIAAYLAKTSEAQAAFIGWIYDTDGYAYWSQPLGKGDVTGLLLNKVNTADSLKEKNIDYYYAIDVITEAVDAEDVPMWTVGTPGTLGQPSIDGSGTKHTVATNDGKTVIGRILALGQEP